MPADAKSLATRLEILTAALEDLETRSGDETERLAPAMRSRLAVLMEEYQAITREIAAAREAVS
jgi:hypothetical protein